MFDDLELLVRPRSLAVFGASQDKAKGPGRIIPLLEAAGFLGDIYPVNPKYQELHGRTCYPSVKDIPETVDLVVIMAPAAAVVDAIAQSAELGVKFAVIMSSGFTEFSAEGAAMQDEITRISRESGMRIYGPNCPGMFNLKDGLPISFSPQLNMDEWHPGRVAVITQGGAMGRAVIDSMETYGTPQINYWFSPGNEADLQAADFLGWLAEDEYTDIVVLIIESFRDGRRFMEAAKRARDAGKVVALLKVGRSEEGVRATATHTAAIAGSDHVVDAALAQCGVVRVDDLDELIDFARLVERYGVTKFDNVGVCSLSGGSAALLADMCGSSGLGVEPPTAPTVSAMAAILPDLAAVGNPVDLTTGIFANPELVEESMRLFINDERIDAAIMPFPYHLGKINEIMANKLVAVASETDKPIIAVGMSEAVLVSEAARILRQAHIPFIQAPTKAVAAAKRYRQLTQDPNRNRDLPPAELSDQSYSDQALKADFPQGKHGSLSEEDSEILLRGAGIDFAASTIVDTTIEAVGAAKGLGFPVVLKAATDLVAHKSDAGLVKVGITDETQLTTAYSQIQDNHRTATGVGHVRVKVAQSLSDGVEMMCGVIMDPAFGPVVSVGIGGIYAEVLADSTLRVCPISQDEAEEMIAESIAAPILAGARGGSPLSTTSLANLLRDLSRFAVVNAEELAGIDINPVLVRGTDAVALDALVVTASDTVASTAQSISELSMPSTDHITATYESR